MLEGEDVEIIAPPPKTPPEFMDLTTVDSDDNEDSNNQNKSRNGITLSVAGGNPGSAMDQLQLLANLQTQTVQPSGQKFILVQTQPKGQPTLGVLQGGTTQPQSQPAALGVLHGGTTQPQGQPALGVLHGGTTQPQGQPTLGVLHGGTTQPQGQPAVSVVQGGSILSQQHLHGARIINQAPIRLQPTLATGNVPSSTLVHVVSQGSQNLLLQKGLSNNAGQIRPSALQTQGPGIVTSHAPGQIRPSVLQTQGPGIVTSHAPGHIRPSALQTQGPSCAPKQIRFSTLQTQSPSHALVPQAVSISQKQLTGIRKSFPAGTLLKLTSKGQISSLGQFGANELPTSNIQQGALPTSLQHKSQAASTIARSFNGTSNSLPASNIQVQGSHQSQVPTQPTGRAQQTVPIQAASNPKSFLTSQSTSTHQTSLGQVPTQPPGRAQQTVPIQAASNPTLTSLLTSQSISAHQISLGQVPTQPQGRTQQTVPIQAASNPTSCLPSQSPSSLQTSLSQVPIQPPGRAQQTVPIQAASNPTSFLTLQTTSAHQTSESRVPTQPPERAQQTVPIQAASNPTSFLTSQSIPAHQTSLGQVPTQPQGRVQQTVPIQAASNPTSCLTSQSTSSHQTSLGQVPTQPQGRAQQTIPIQAASNPTSCLPSQSTYSHQTSGNQVSFQTTVAQQTTPIQPAAIPTTSSLLRPQVEIISFQSFPPTIMTSQLASKIARRAQQLDVTLKAASIPTSVSSPGGSISDQRTSTNQETVVEASTKSTVAGSNSVGVETNSGVQQQHADVQTTSMATRTITGSIAKQNVTATATPKPDNVDLLQVDDAATRYKMSEPREEPTAPILLKIPGTLKLSKTEETSGTCNDQNPTLENPTDKPDGSDKPSTVVISRSKCRQAETREIPDHSNPVDKPDGSSDKQSTSTRVEDQEETIVEGSNDMTEKDSEPMEGVSEGGKIKERKDTDEVGKEANVRRDHETPTAKKDVVNQDQWMTSKDQPRRKVDNFRMMTQVTCVVCNLSGPDENLHKISYDRSKPEEPSLAERVSNVIKINDLYGTDRGICYPLFLCSSCLDDVVQIERLKKKFKMGFKRKLGHLNWNFTSDEQLVIKQSCSSKLDENDDCQSTSSSSSMVSNLKQSVDDIFKQTASQIATVWEEASSNMPIGTTPIRAEQPDNGLSFEEVRWQNMQGLFGQRKNVTFVMKMKQTKRKKTSGNVGFNKTKIGRKNQLHIKGKKSKQRLARNLTQGLDMEATTNTVTLATLRSSKLKAKKKGKKKKVKTGNMVVQNPFVQAVGMDIYIGGNSKVKQRVKKKEKKKSKKEGKGEKKKEKRKKGVKVVSDLEEQKEKKKKHKKEKKT